MDVIKGIINFGAETIEAEINHDDSTWKLIDHMRMDDGTEMLISLTLDLDTMEVTFKFGETTKTGTLS